MDRERILQRFRELSGGTKCVLAVVAAVAVPWLYMAGLAALLETI